MTYAELVAFADYVAEVSGDACHMVIHHRADDLPPLDCVYRRLPPPHRLGEFLVDVTDAPDLATAKARFDARRHRPGE